MRIAYLAAGAAGMYCGSCMRDNRLVATLLAAGRDVVLMPLYTPLRSDEPVVGESRVRYGGVNVYLQQRFRLPRRLPTWMTRVLDAPSLLRRVMRWSKNLGPGELGSLTVSVLRGEHGAQRAELARLIRVLGGIEPDVVHLPNLMFVGVAGELRRSLGVPIVCTLSGEDIFLDELIEPHRSEAFRLIASRSRDIDAFVAVTEYYAGYATHHFDLPPDRVHVVPMGVHVEDFREVADPPAGPFTIGYLARICPAKGLDRLAEAFIQLRRDGRNCRLRIAGYLGEADTSYLDGVRGVLNDPACQGAVDYVGEVTRREKIDFLRSLHVLSVPTVYHEAKGLFVIEAMAAGVPVVQPSHGSFPELVEATGGGLLYAPSGPSATGRLVEAIGRLMDEPKLRRELGERGLASVSESFTDKVMAERTWELYERIRNAG